MIPEVGRRARAVRWMVSLSPMFKVISTKANSLGLGKPRLESGPTLLSRKNFDDLAGDRIRKGAVWFVGDRNCGFHVDFCANGQTHIEAWTGGERKTSTWISGDVSELSLKRDLTVCLVAAGLTDLARTEEVRARLFPRNG
jgi:hypothetical protein